VLAIGRDALPGTDSRFQPASLQQPPLPQRLTPIADIETSLLPKIGSQENIKATVSIEVDQAKALLQLPSAGIATFQSQTGSDFRWLPLKGATLQANDTLLIKTESNIGERITVTLSARREQARHGYINRTQIEVQAKKDGSSNAVKVSGRTYRVTFNLPTSVERAGPLRLQRKDDRTWLPMQHDTTGLTLTKGQKTILELGAGAYELLDPLAPEHTQSFRIADDTAVEVIAEFAPTRDGRP
jgi:hypothetical protein